MKTVLLGLGLVLSHSLAQAQIIEFANGASAPQEHELPVRLSDITHVPIISYSAHDWITVITSVLNRAASSASDPHYNAVNHFHQRLTALRDDQSNRNQFKKNMGKAREIRINPYARLIQELEHRGFTPFTFEQEVPFLSDRLNILNQAVLDAQQDAQARLGAMEHDMSHDDVDAILDYDLPYLEIESDLSVEQLYDQLQARLHVLEDEETVRQMRARGVIESAPQEAPAIRIGSPSVAHIINTRIKQLALASVDTIGPSQSRALSALNLEIDRMPARTAADKEAIRRLGLALRVAQYNDAVLNEYLFLDPGIAAINTDIQKQKIVDKEILTSGFEFWKWRLQDDARRLQSWLVQTPEATPKDAKERRNLTSSEITQLERYLLQELPKIDTRVTGAQEIVNDLRQGVAFLPSWKMIRSSRATHIRARLRSRLVIPLAVVIVGLLCGFLLVGFTPLKAEFAALAIVGVAAWQLFLTCARPFGISWRQYQFLNTVLSSNQVNPADMPKRAKSRTDQVAQWEREIKDVRERRKHRLQLRALMTQDPLRPSVP